MNPPEAYIAGRTAAKSVEDRKARPQDLAEGKYVYAIIACDEPREFKNRGIGERGDKVHTINHRQMAAVVSDSPTIDYERSRRNMMAHTVVLEEVMKEFDLLPLRFGTVASSAESVERQLLVPRYGELSAMLEKMRGRSEFGLKAFWHEGVAFGEIVRENARVRKLRDALQGRSLEESYYQRIQLGEEVEKALTAIRARDEELILSRLRPFMRDIRTNKIISDRMVLNAAFLVERGDVPALDEAIRQLDQEFSERLMFKYVGPVPPYNFVNIAINWER
ncbi:Gas vesicle synthesis protein GvpL/GvpF [Enhydrobacter aerosaccus]|uniref:Gas vesicle synthesis protein GvpL/GvpF n=1 Tax=Enhydrobacter aerosaccus TaxID=225324 RepID=A0A1T4LVQ1_9HYPH|nr:GvpL/GvpF family gas vesicle protein [Enhydrobacter aerosaccus]SJZ58765.1 Gas vesicle synthesis protein GvpL/GvpF [Enhydrobacter aerosaccus]